MIISVDDHVVEPPNVWQDRLPSKYAEVGPRIVRAPMPEVEFRGGSLKVKPGQGKAAFRSAISGMMTVVGPSQKPPEVSAETEPEETSPDRPVPPDADTVWELPEKADEDLGEATAVPGEASTAPEATAPESVDREEVEE